MDDTDRETSKSAGVAEERGGTDDSGWVVDRGRGWALLLTLIVAAALQVGWGVGNWRWELALREREALPPVVIPVPTTSQDAHPCRTSRVVMSVDRTHSDNGDRAVAMWAPGTRCGLWLRLTPELRQYLWQKILSEDAL